MPDLGVGDVVRALRTTSGMTQQRLADLAGVGRIEVIAVEKGRNKATSIRMRDGLARAFGLTREDMSLVLEKKITVNDALSRRADAA